MSASHGVQTRSTYVPKNAAYSKEVKLRTLDNINRGIWSPSKAATKVGCALQTVLNWIKQKENNRELHDFSHRPPYVSPKLKDEILKELHGKSKKGRAEPKRKFGTNLQNKINEARLAQNKSPVTIKKRYCDDFVRQENLHTGNAEVESNAHEIAINDPRHAASFAAMIHHLHSVIPKGQFINMDKTNFEWKKADQEKAEAIYYGPRGQSLKTSASESPIPTGNCVVSVYMVSDSFKITGISPFSPKAIRQQCRYNWSGLQEQQFIEAVPELGKRFGLNFELNESDFDELNIPVNNQPKDNVSIHKRRALLLYAPHILQLLHKQATSST